MSHFSSADLTVVWTAGGTRGYSDAQIRALGRWKSYAFKVYLRSEVLHAN